MAVAATVLAPLACVGRQPFEQLPDVVPGSVSFSVHSLVLGVGDTITVEATPISTGGVPLPITNLESPTSNAAVATVTDVSERGLFEAIGVGSTTVSVKVLGTSLPPQPLKVRVD